MRWTEAMSVGVPELDEEHQIIIAVINRIDSSSVREAAVHQSLSTLRRYAEFHFDREQRVMEVCNFPELDQHIESHQEFIRQLDHFDRQLTIEGVELAKPIAKFLTDWLNHHILIQDMA